MPPVPPVLLKARIAANRVRLFRRMLDLLRAFDLEDLSLFTEEQQAALLSARELVEQIQKPLPEDT